MMPMDKRIQRAFDAVQAGDGLKDSTADFLHQKLYARPQHTARRRAVPAVCCALLLLLAFTGYGVYSMPVAAISVEAAETVELQVNAFDRVVAYACLSPGGQAEIDALGLTHKTYGDAVAALVENGGEEAAVSVAAGDAEKNASITAEIEARCAGVACRSADTETLEAAGEVGLGVRRYEAYLAWKALDPTVTPDDVRSLSMREIRSRIAALSAQSDAESTASPAPDSTGTQNEKGSQNGKGPQTGAGAHSGGQGNQHRRGQSESRNHSTEP